MVTFAGLLVEHYEYTPYGQRQVFSHGWLMNDFDGDGDVDGNDFDVWDQVSEQAPPDHVADIDGDGDVDNDDAFEYDWEHVPDINDPLVLHPSSGGSYRNADALTAAIATPLNEFGHQGLMHDEELVAPAGNLIYNRARMLHPGLGRFVQRDPLGYVDGMSVYTYGLSAPTQERDPSGKASKVVPTPPAQVKKCETTCAKKGQVLTHTTTTRYDYNLGICKFGWQITKCHCRPPSKNPGRCTPQQHAYLQHAKDVACTGARKPWRSMDCTQLLTSYSKNTACAAAREAINKKCYGGGNPTHQNLANQHRRWAAQALEYMRDKGCPGFHT